MFRGSEEPGSAPHTCSLRLPPESDTERRLSHRKWAWRRDGVQDCSALTGGGILRRLKTRVSPRLRDAMVGWGPSEASSSLCQPMLSRPSRYRLQSSELKLQPLRSATASRRRRSHAGHCGSRIAHRRHQRTPPSHTLHSKDTSSRRSGRSVRPERWPPWWSEHTCREALRTNRLAWARHTPHLEEEEEEGGEQSSLTQAWRVCPGEHDFSAPLRESEGSVR